MNVLGFGFAVPWALAGLLALPALWFLLRLMPPRPHDVRFPPFRLLLGLAPANETAAHMPLWLLILRLCLAALLILIAAGPVWQPPSHAGLTDRGALVLILDNGWAAATGWERRLDEARALVAEAGQRDMLVSIAPTAAPALHALTPVSASRARQILDGLAPRPFAPSRADLARRLADALAQAGQEAPTLIWLSDGLATPDDAAFTQTLRGISPHPLHLRLGGLPLPHALAFEADDGRMSVVIQRADPSTPETLTLIARDRQQRLIARQTVPFDAGQTRQRLAFDLPLAIENDIARILIDGEASAGARLFADAANRRKRVGIVSGEGARAAQPLLSGAAYVERALRPFCDIIIGETGSVSDDIERMLDDQADVIVLIDIGTLEDALQSRLEAWLRKGGLLLRFAGPALTIAANPLVPVPLRRGDRQLGGALSWETPQKLAPFPENSPYAGLDVPRDVRISRQVLAEPGSALDEHIWAELEDGTPLVTARADGDGLIVLVHVTADTRWSNLPLSGLFPRMLRQSLSFARLRTASGAGSGAVSGATPTAPVTLPPLVVLDGLGRETPPPAHNQPLTLTPGVPVPRPDARHAPGLYGATDATLALNLHRPGDTLARIDPATLPDAFEVTPYPQRIARDMRAPLLVLAALLALTDGLGVLLLGGFLTGWKRVAPLVVPALLAASLIPDPAGAEDAADRFALQALDATRFAYVLSGDAALDTLSRQGLEGLATMLAERTSLEPGSPIGVDPARDELAFFPLLYWPMPSTPQAAPTSALTRRIDAYMRNGGTILFDTRDAASPPGATLSVETANLRRLLASLDVPPLVPVPANHVLTRAFYLLETFPGRHATAPLWVEPLPGGQEGRLAQQPTAQQPADQERPALAGDGISRLIITGNDFAGAWALDASGYPVLPTLPPDPRQREAAYRAGINIAIYVLTGNYKADQVHVPALLQRLGR